MLQGKTWINDAYFTVHLKIIWGNYNKSLNMKVFWSFWKVSLDSSPYQKNGIL